MLASFATDEGPIRKIENKTKYHKRQPYKRKLKMKLAFVKRIEYNIKLAIKMNSKRNSAWWKHQKSELDL